MNAEIRRSALILCPRAIAVFTAAPGESIRPIAGYGLRDFRRAPSDAVA
jgi:hypothetical protein